MFFDRVAPTPGELAPGLTVRRQRPDDNDSDYEAVTANRDWLRRWSGSDWPEDTFTSADNAADLRGHIEDHEACEALGYTIAAPGNRVVGSLYLQPLAELLDEYGASAQTREQLEPARVRADVWTRLDEDATLLARAVAVIDPWLRTQWPTLVWGARADCPELEAAYEAAGSRLLARLVHPANGRIHLLFGPAR
jgi:hypothetical protein